MRLIKLICAAICGYTSWYLLNIVLLCLRFWLKIVGILVTDEFMSIFRKPMSPIMVEEAYSDNAKITKSLDTLVSWLLEKDHDGSYVNMKRVQDILGNMPLYIRLTDKYINLSQNGRRAIYTDKRSRVKFERDVLANCLMLNHANTD